MKLGWEPIANKDLERFPWAGMFLMCPSTDVYISFNFRFVVFNSKDKCLSYQLHDYIFNINYVDTTRKITGWARTHYNKSNTSAFKLHYTDEELDTTDKVWQKK